MIIAIFKFWLENTFNLQLFTNQFYNNEYKNSSYIIIYGNFIYNMKKLAKYISYDTFRLIKKILNKNYKVFHSIEILPFSILT